MEDGERRLLGTLVEGRVIDVFYWVCGSISAFPTWDSSTRSTSTTTIITQSVTW